MVLEQPVRILAEAAVVGPPGRLHVRHAPRLLPEHAEQGFRVRGAGADFQVERLLEQAAVGRPERRQLQNEILKGHAWRRRSRNTRSDFNVFSRCIVMSARCTASSSLSTRRSVPSSPTRCGGVASEAVKTARAPSESEPCVSGYTP